ncbi:transposase [Deinococcus yavapaiensis KR-236]|uniref:Transposase n=1 Tax=Deinococcus yavapaiensis KR-236 TaxID=694435 RepID=A0A318S7S3_9DEIO|nr:transposase [Deinococcus yavapaiensis KR-236]
MGRTWAPRGKTPIIKTHLRWHSLSIIGAITSNGRVFQNTYPHAIRAVHVVAFLEHLLFFVPGPITVILDRAGIHRAKVVQAFVAAQPRLRVVYLPPYAPELNPVELLWAYVKRHVLGNFVAKDLRDLKRRWTQGFAVVRRRAPQKPRAGVLPACARLTSTVVNNRCSLRPTISKHRVYFLKSRMIILTKMPPAKRAAAATGSDFLEVACRKTSM